MSIEDDTPSAAELRRRIIDRSVLGGSAMGRAAALLLAATATERSSSSTRVVADAVVEAAHWLIATRPSMATVYQPARMALELAESRSSLQLTGADLALFLQNVMTRYAQRSLHAVDLLGGFGSKLLADPSTVVVHSYSASVIAVLMSALGDRARLTIRMTESRPFKETRMLAEACKDSNALLELYPDAGIALAASGATLGLVGCDAVLPNGSFINKTGTHLLGLACRDAGIPLYVVGELGKVVCEHEDAEQLRCEANLAGDLVDGWALAKSGRIIVRDQLFEVVPHYLVTAFVTEIGVIVPSAIVSEARRSFEALL